jgi:hypothetical protein
MYFSFSGSKRLQNNEVFAIFFKEKLENLKSRRTKLVSYDDAQLSIPKLKKKSTFVKKWPKAQLGHFD